MRPAFDDKDSELLSKRLAEWEIKRGPRVGDYVIMQDGEVRRFTHAWKDDIQVTNPSIDKGGSFYFGYGNMSYSGCLDRAIPYNNLRDTKKTRPGAVWFFHHDEARAHNGVYCEIPCRVFKIVTNRRKICLLPSASR